MWEFPKIRVPFWGVPIIRAILCCPLILGNYHVGIPFGALSVFPTIWCLVLHRIMSLTSCADRGSGSGRTALDVAQAAACVF